MLSFDPLAPAPLPAGVMVFGATTFWLVTACLFGAAVVVRIAIAAAHEARPILRTSRRPVRHLRLVRPTRAS